MSFADVQTDVVSNHIGDIAVVKNVAAAPLKISAPSDIYGHYEYQTIDQSSGGVVTLSPTIVAGVGANDVDITNFPFGDLPMPAVVDVAAGTLTLQKVDTGIYNSQYGENQMYGPITWNADGSFAPVESLALTINSDGIIEFPVVNGYPTGIAMYISQGFFMAYCGGIGQNDPGSLKPLHELAINLDEWKDYGTAMFSEPILNTLIVSNGYDAVPPYEVKMMVNKENPNKYLVVNPYETDAFEQYGFTNGMDNATGYYLVDATDPLCVLCEPLVGSGFSYPYSQNPDGSFVYEEICVFNMEAMMVRNGYTTEDVYYEYGANEEYASFMEDDEINLLHIRFSFNPSNLLGVYNWTDGDESIPMEPCFITFDKNGVEGVEFDENAPVKYFNLQGVEVANPEKGQLVIKRQGSKAQKIVVR